MKRRGKNTLGRKRIDLQALVQKTRDGIATLMGLARTGNRDAALELYRATHLGVGFLHQTSITNPDVIRSIASGHDVWPVMFNPHRDTIDGNNEFVRAIGLGSETGSSFMDPRSPSSVCNPAIEVVKELHRMAKALIQVPKRNWTYREWMAFGPATTRKAGEVNWEALEAWGQTGAGSRLPQLSKSTATLWSKETVELFDLAYGDGFDEHPDLWELRDHHQYAKDSAGVKNSVSAIRRAMRKAIKQAWRGYAVRDR